MFLCVGNGMKVISLRKLLGGLKLDSSKALQRTADVPLTVVGHTLLPWKHENFSRLASILIYLIS